MVFKRTKAPTAWGTAAAEIIHAAGVDKATVAEDTALSKQHLGNCLNGFRRPSKSDVSRINRVIAKLVGYPQVATLLECEAWLCGLLEAPVVRRQMLIAHALNLLASYESGRLFRVGWRKRIAAYIRGCDEAGAFRFAAEINRAFQRLIIAQLRPPSEPVGFDSICQVLARNGFAADLLTEHGVFRVARERFQWAVRREIATANPQSTYRERFMAEARILRVLEEHFELRLRTGKQPHREEAKP